MRILIVMCLFVSLAGCAATGRAYEAAPAPAEDRALVYNMTPGTGVHIPVNTPHWLKNGNNVSITLNVNFQFHDAEIANLYKANYYLRKLGLKPSVPGARAGIDRVKAWAFTCALSVKRKLKPGDGVVPVEAKEQKKRIAAMLVER